MSSVDVDGFLEEGPLFREEDPSHADASKGIGGADRGIPATAAKKDHGDHQATITDPLTEKAQSNNQGAAGGDDIKASLHRTASMLSIHEDSLEVLTENSFSLMYIAEVKSSSFVFPLLCAVTQITLLAMAISDMTDRHSDNPFNIPSNVSPQVRVAGILCLVISHAVFFDFMNALGRLLQGPAVTGIVELPGATPWKFYFAYTLQLALGLIFEVSLFILIIQSDNVQDVFFNYPALEFISNLDDVLFTMASNGYTSALMKEQSETIKDHKLVQIPSHKGIILRRSLYVLVAAVLMGFYIAIWVREYQGHYMKQQVEVQFGDGLITILPFFSGIYNRVPGEIHHGRPIYKHESKLDKLVVFRYCREGGYWASSGYWVFNFERGDSGNAFDESTHDIATMCESWIMRSPDTPGYDILDTATSDWVIRHLWVSREKSDSDYSNADKWQDYGEVFVGKQAEKAEKWMEDLHYPVDYFLLRDNDCDESSTCNGKCVDNMCVCDRGLYGPRCQFDVHACESIDYDHRNSPLSVQARDDSYKFDLLKTDSGKDVLKYGKNVYFGTNDGGSEMNVLINLGRRFAMVPLNKTSVPNTTALVDYVEKMHPFYDWIEPWFFYQDNVAELIRTATFVTDPVDYGLPSDRMTPIGLSWYRVGESDITTAGNMRPSSGVDARLLCTKCSDFWKHGPKCLNEGKCNDETQTCTCDEGFDGPLCERENEALESNV